MTNNPMTNDPAAEHQAHLTVRTLDDLLACVPYLLGFRPGTDLVLVALRDGRVEAAARQELPATLDHTARAAMTLTWDRLTDQLASAGVTAAILIGYGPASQAEPAVALAADRLQARAIHVVQQLRVADGRCFDLLADQRDSTPDDAGDDRTNGVASAGSDGVPVDPGNSPVAAAAALAGIAPAASRDELAARLAPITGPARTAMSAATLQVAEELVALLNQAAQSNSIDNGDKAAAAGAADRDTDRELCERGLGWIADARRRYSERDTVDVVLAARVTVMANQPDVLAATMQQATGQQWELDMWVDLTRRAEPDFTAGPAILLTANAVKAGNGALANLALERAYRNAPDGGVVEVLANLLNAGVPLGAIAELLKRTRR